MKKAKRMEVVTVLDVLEFAHDRQDVGDFGNCALGTPVSCGFCGEPATDTEASVTLDWFDICPACILSGPKHVAGLADRVAGNAAWIRTRYGYDGTGFSDSEDAENMVKAYRVTANKCAALESFKDLPGGVVAVAIAAEFTRLKTGKKHVGSPRRAA
jgi:hypothetical protein